MVVFEDGKPRSGEYRRFRIRTVQGPNDFASHQEVLRRRFRTVAGTARRGVEEARRWAMPDLVIVDGGKGQVSAAKEVLDELGLHDLPLAGLAKEREELFLPGRTDPIVLPATSPALYLVQRLRDEAHRFAITYHRDLRAKRSVRSAFDDLPGVGPKRKRELLKVFGSIKRVRDAPVEQIAAVPGHRARAGGADQGDARGLTPGFGSEFFIVPVHRIATGRRLGSPRAPRRRVATPEGMLPRCTSDATDRRASAAGRRARRPVGSDATRPRSV